MICWVLGEYGTADGKYSASYITGKLCDVAEAYSNDETVKVSHCFFECLVWSIFLNENKLVWLHLPLFKSSLID